MSMSIGGATVMLVEARRGGMDAEGFKTRLDMVLAVMNNGAIARVSSYYGSDEHLNALDEIEAHLVNVRASIAEDRAAEARHVVEAITFENLVQYGRDNGANIVNGMPWSFEYKGYHVTHENDRLYLVCRGADTLRFAPDDMLLSHADDTLSVSSKLCYEEGLVE